MAGLKLVLPISFTDNTMPILRDDPRLNPGSLLLADIGHPNNPVSGVPVDGTAIPNIAWKESAALCAVSGATSASLPLTYKSGAAFSAAGTTKGKVERTPKGGIHFIVSQALALSAGDGAQFSMSSTILNYIKANPTHAYYVSAWMRPTRLNVSPSTKGLALFEFGTANTGGGIIQFMDSASNSGSPWAASLGDVPAAISLSNQRASHATQFPTSRIVTDAVLNSTTTVTSASANFTSADVGKLVAATGIGGGVQITAVVNSTTVTIGTAATATASGVSLTIGGGMGLGATMNAGPTPGYANGGGNTYNAAVISGRNQTASSFVAYAWHVCDLTAAGLTYAQVEATDLIEFNNQFNSPTGRYYNDTIPTAPSTIA